jgi:AcrR family transcriptional regulator
MARPSQIDQQRKKLLPVVCRVFSELGYRRATTAELARRCGVRENILYRLWPDKKAMFLAAIDDVFQQRAAMWSQLLADAPGAEQAAGRLVAYEARHQGEFGFYRIVFTALAETDDADIRAALVRMYRGFQRLVRRQIEASRGSDAPGQLPADAAAWALIGLATVSNISRHLELLGPRQREHMFAVVAKNLVNGATVKEAVG